MPTPLSHIKPRKKLSRTLLIGAMVTAITIFGLTLLAASQIVSKTFYNQSAENAQALSRLSFDNMYQIMSQGWSRSQLLDFRQEIWETYDEQGLSYSIYRAEPVNEQFGKLDSMLSSSIQPYIDQVLANPQKTVVEEEDWIRILQPLEANQTCLKCHVNAEVGDVLGVMAIEQDLGAVLQPARVEFVIWMLLLLPIPILLAWWVGQRFSNSLVRSVEELNDRVLSIQQVDDIKNLSHGQAVFEYAEFNQLNISLNQLGDKIKNIAIDRDILDFEIQLLDRLVLSSEIIKDWKHHISILMEEINKILPLYTLFVVFRTDDSEQYVIEIFWLGHPTDEVKKEVEAYAKETLAQVSIFDENSVFKVNHTYATSQKLQVTDEIKTQSKSLVLDRPKIGGVVGLGVETLPPRDSSRSIVVESILTTLVNVIGSIKAINKFTKELEYYATRDPLTHLFNQRVFHEMLSYEVGRAHNHGYEFALLMIDFDNFKLINDQYGHSFGDEMLIEFAKVVRKALREGDIFARYGGDEFCVILPETNGEEAVRVARSVLENAGGIRLTSPQGRTVCITCSIGVGVYPGHADNKEDLFMVADNMLYRAKDTGKNALSFPEEDDLVEVYRESNDQSVFIMDAIETGEPIEAHYQPIVNMQDGSVEVHELLMRLRQESELVSAGRFIETAEHMGLVNQMDLILIDKALAEMNEKGYVGRLFINLSPKAIVAGEFIQKVLALTNKYQIDHERIVFEITERETVHNITLLEKFVGELRAEGFRFAIDDFGSGFSSFQYLKRFPVDYIKIEGEFINNMTKNKIDLAFVESAVSMAKTLGIQTVAEFIENEETLRLVQELGIDYAQGFLLARPGAELLTGLPENVANLFESVSYRP
ncbi:MAG: bifunctional diguanylate cyclase/phosphodiesterase [Hydrogenovibrio sp.]|uniref:putative bifunctional diguanylate cyclase/phosphodiesterase n=1 Tax=Hydrogenovibrio sp. TaxID=2065821 RepID=UPI00287009F3|nr:bifunctional diguanylate cyclase/phosphodiesterase [Hydrogenovibrio sp.]MDR9498685.1 bifunctional diguanylate cyclase/phosphodiesterase [Hydrogenovibrio sp.]